MPFWVWSMCPRTWPPSSSWWTIIHFGRHWRRHGWSHLSFFMPWPSSSSEFSFPAPFCIVQDRQSEVDSWNDRLRHLWRAGWRLLWRSCNPPALCPSHPQPVEGEAAERLELWKTELPDEGFSQGGEDPLWCRKGLRCWIDLRSRTPVCDSGAFE